jgi:hypothetical protein
VLAVSFFDPSGEYEWIYADNIVVEGTTLKKTYPVPYNEKEGRWKVNVRDAGSGIFSEREFDIL